MTTLTRGRIVEDPGAGRMELFALDTAEPSLLALLRDLFEANWQQIQFGTLIQGSVFEIQAAGPPKRLSMLDGYVTVDFETVETDDAVTIRNRDSMEQVRVPVAELADRLREQLKAMGGRV